MTVDTKYDAFHELNKKRQKTSPPDFQLELFQMPPIDPQTPKSDYWYYSDLHNILGEILFPITPSMQFHAYDRLILPYNIDPSYEKYFPKSRASQFYTQHIDRTKRAYKLHSHNPDISDTLLHNAYDTMLSRYACWCFAKDRSTFARAYFISPLLKENITFEELQQYSTEYYRIYLRPKVSELENQLSGAIKGTGANFRDFYNQTNPYLFGGMTHADVKALNPEYISQDDTLLDYMGKHTLRARFCALRRTLDTYRHHPIKTAQTLRNLLIQELSIERGRMIHKAGIAPEQDILSTQVQKVASQLNKIEKQFVKQYATQTIR